MAFKKEQESWNEELILINKNSSEKKKFTILNSFRSEGDRRECLGLIETIMQDRISIFKVKEGIACDKDLQDLLKQYERLLDSTERSIEYYASFEHPSGTWLSLTETEDCWIVGEEEFLKKDWYPSTRKENILWTKRRILYRLFSLKLLLHNLKNKDYNTLHDVWVNLVSRTLREKITPFLFNFNIEDLGEDLIYRKLLSEVNNIINPHRRPAFNFDSSDFMIKLEEDAFLLKTFYLLLEGETSPFNNKYINPRLSCGNIEWAEAVLKMGGMFGPDKGYKFLKIEKENERHFVTMRELTAAEYNNLYSVSPLKVNI